MNYKQTFKIQYSKRENITGVRNDQTIPNTKSMPIKKQKGRAFSFFRGGWLESRAPKALRGAGSLLEQTQA